MLSTVYYHYHRVKQTYLKSDLAEQRQSLDPQHKLFQRHSLYLCKHVGCQCNITVSHANQMGSIIELQMTISTIWWLMNLSISIYIQKLIVIFLAQYVTWVFCINIPGIGCSCILFSYRWLVNKWKHTPAATRPARPFRCSAFARDTHTVSRLSIPLEASYLWKIKESINQLIGTHAVATAQKPFPPSV